jgi:hypothetical protein
MIARTGVGLKSFTGLFTCGQLERTKMLPLIFMVSAAA